ncbi:alpha-2-macroglobulin family protein [Mucilaginibacter gossypii]|uniref:alpha-2-macroglobulin family protein n=1 Tax=Mucilaginibacter gossypii TaxID=551996 RepID=UPI0016751E74|nr:MULTISPECIES: alpha-2-macroglobulin family protein [Mucilaginibacter]QTE37435.1 alpha-2-macroglobulin family protein [Mucilaginibacter gossypii]
MLSKLARTLACLLVLSLIISVNLVSAQNKYDALSFRIDSLAAVGLPKSALKEVDKLDKLAHDESNAPQQIHAVIYRMTFQSYIEENALVVIITRLKADIDKAKYPAKPVLQSMLAEMYWHYYQENRYNYNQRSRLETPGDDYTKWDLQTIISETSKQYRLSLADVKQLQATPIGTLDGVLKGDKSIRYLRPTLYDLLAQRAFEFFLADEPEIIKPKMAFSLNDPAFFGAARSFIKLNISSADTASSWYQGIKLLQQASAFHLHENNIEAIADLELQRLRFLHDKSTLVNADSLYLSGLKQTAADFAAKPISAEALVQLGRYYQNHDSLVMAYSYYEKAKGVFPNSISGKNAVAYIQELEKRALSAQVEEVYAPGKPLLASLQYANVKQAEFVIYGITDAQIDQLKKDNKQDEEEELTITKRVYDFVSKLKPIEAGNLSLPEMHDYKDHQTEFKIAPLKPGNYILMVDDSSVYRSSLTGLAEFKVSGLAYVTRQRPDGLKEIRVLDRDSGKPLKGIKVNVYNTYNNKGKTMRNPISNGVSDVDGVFTFSCRENHFNADLSTVGDKLMVMQSYLLGAVETQQVAAKTIERTILFTDRQIYRPGQTVYFKGLQISTLNNKSSIVPNEQVIVSLFDANRQKQGILNLKTNEYGTVTGSFIIPQQTLGGMMSVTTDHGSALIRVEEYKRPTFQVTFSPVKETYKFNDSVCIKGKVTAFSGYGLSGAKVAYHVKRIAAYRPYYLKMMGDSFEDANNVEIASDTIKANDNGEFNFAFRASASDGKLPDMYNYNITANVTDGSGETQSANTIVKVSNNVLDLELRVPEQLSAKDQTIIPVKLSNINGQPQNGLLNVKVYSLNRPDGVFKKRLWDEPDQYLMTIDEFKTLFAGYAYKKEDKQDTWQINKTIIEADVKVSDTTNSQFDLAGLKQQPTGVYKLIINAKDDKGDTTSQTYYIKVNNEPGKAPDMDSWATTINDKIDKAGQTAEFWLGISRESHILVEKYEGPKMLSSEWLTVGGDHQQSLKIPVPATAKNNFAVQFLMLNDNRLYRSYTHIKIKDTASALKIRLLTFRDKLQPGEKEQWKLQVSAPGKEKKEAELLAGMYDASLDDVALPQTWDQQLPVYNYDPDYFDWRSFTEFVIAIGTATFDQAPYYTHMLNFDYETLNWFGYSYFGGDNYGYNTYTESVKEYKKGSTKNKQIEALYIKNAALVKNGYIVSGRILDTDGEPQDNVKIAIKNTRISTISNSFGFYKIKVPQNATLVFSKKYFTIKYVNLPQNGYVYIASTIKFPPPVTSDESVDSSDVKQGQLEPPAVSALKGNLYGYSNAVGFNAPVVKPDAEVLYKGDNVVIREKQVGKFSMHYDELRSDPKPINTRKNFNETAFFYPQLRTDEKGEVLIEFTMPEALTKWKFRAFAHDKQLQLGYTEAEVVTQKQLSINANMPRFLREGDTVVVSARLANLEGEPLKGQVELRLFNGINMQPVELLTNKDDAQQKFEIGASATKSISFKLVIPPGLDALTYRLTADAGKYTDGEENTIPVLPNRMLVTESLPMMVRVGQTKTFNFDKLINNSSTTLKSKTLTLEYSQNPAWNAVQAIPYMMEFPYECSEQLFSRYYANSLSTDLISKMQLIKQVFDQWKSGDSKELLSNLEKNQELKTTLLEETPWLQDALSESEQKKRIAQLFDLNKMSYEMKANLDKLKQKQLPNGAFPWFGGNYADDYITRHVLEEIGQLYHLKIATADNKILKEIAGKALGYMDAGLIKQDKEEKKQKDYQKREIGYDEAHAWYVRSYYTDKQMEPALKSIFNNYLKRAEDQWVTRSIYEQGMIALTMVRNGKPLVTKAIIKSLMETAQTSDEMGMYWGKNMVGYYWYQSPIETQSLMIELFTEAGNNAKAVEEMKIWLMRNKQTNNWKTTKATAAAVYALLLKQEDWLQGGAASEIKLDNKPLAELKPEVKADAGIGYIKTSWIDDQVKPALGKVEVKNNGKSISYGAMYWQYLEQMDKINPSQTDIHLERKYFIKKQTDAGPVLQEVDVAHQPKTGDLLKVVVYLKAGRDYEYVQLKDLRPAGTEPITALSEYKYQDGLSYYQVSKDVATNFFISYLNKGSYVFEYELRVTQPGNFSTGITSIQCMYAPEFNAHSEGSRVVFK